MWPKNISLTSLRLAILLGALLAPVALAGCGGSSGEMDPSKAPTATMPANLPEPMIMAAAPGGGGPGGARTYVVKSGDTPSSIAEKFSITTDELMKANNITDARLLAVGQTLTIPGQQQATTGFPTPQPSPTKAAGSPTAAAASPTKAPVTPTAPAATPTAPAATPTPAVAPTPREGETTYVVQAGDYPEKIAAMFGITAAELMAANGITDPSSLQVGQVLIIPAAGGAPPAEEPTPEPAEPTPQG